MILAPTGYVKAQNKGDVNKLSFQYPFTFHVDQNFWTCNLILTEKLKSKKIYAQSIIKVHDERKKKKPKHKELETVKSNIPKQYSKILFSLSFTRKN